MYINLSVQISLKTTCDIFKMKFFWQPSHLALLLIESQTDRQSDRQSDSVAVHIWYELRDEVTVWYIYINITIIIRTSTFILLLDLSYF